MPDSELCLSNLLPELILIVARIGEESLESVRLISPHWNSCVLTHLTDRRYLPVLERVFLRDGTESDLEEGDDAVERPEDEEHVCMYAIVPESCAPARIGLDKWLSVHERFPEAIEVTCKPETVAKEIEEKDAPNDDVHSRTTILAGSVLSFLSSIGIAGLFAVKRKYSFAGACALLAASPLLVCYQNSTTEDTPEIIEELTRLHRIKHVSIVTEFLRKKHFSDFAAKVVRMGATLDIYQEISEDDHRFFLRDRQYWERKAAELEMNGLSMEISCNDDADFEDRLSLRQIKMHLRIRTPENRGDRYSIFDNESRGYDNY